jgi:hypothetical protein
VETHRNKNWKWPFWCALAVTVVSLYPQILMWTSRGREWNGSYAQVNGDEWLYSAYVQALIDGRPRRSDPYTGRDDTAQVAQPESVFSIQFIPAYLIAIPARLLGVSASTAFIAVGMLAPFLLCLSIYSLALNVSGDQRFAAAASVVAISFGGLAARTGLISLWGSGLQYFFLPFLRRYEPALMIPLFFVFCGFVWRSLTSSGRQALGWALAAGVSLDILVFSYLYLWTTAVAWLGVLVVSWIVAQPKSLAKQGPSVAVIVLSCGAALIPYLFLLSHRSATLDSGQKLTMSHAPDLFRIPELIGVAATLMIVSAALRRRINWRAPEILFALSLSLTPLVVFNQQVITGRSLQPFHYEMFIANYVALAGAALAVFLAWQARQISVRQLGSRAAVRVLIIALWWASVEVVIHTKAIVRESQHIDGAAAVCQRLRQRSISNPIGPNAGEDPRPLVLTTDYDVSIILPTFAPQAVLWSPNFDFLNLQPSENKNRLYEYLYYTGMDREGLVRGLRKPMSTLAAVVFGHERVLPDLAVNVVPITSQEIEAKAADYEEFCRSFSRETAASHTLSYVIASPGADLRNVDRWYQRGQGEGIGSYILYSVHLR